MKEKEFGYKDVFRQKEFTKLIISNIINRFGDSIDEISLTWIVYENTRSAFWSALIFALTQIPSIIVQPLLGPIIEKSNKKLIMVVSDLLRGITIIILILLYITDSLNPFILIFYTLFVSTVECFRIPASMSLIPNILEKKIYDYGLSLNNSISSIIQIIGLASAGGIIALGGVKLAMALDAITFILSLLIIMWIKPKNNNSEEMPQNNSYLLNLKNGFNYVMAKPIIRNFCILAFLINAFLVPFNSLQTPLVVDVLHKSALLLSIFSIFIMIGMSCGSALCPLFIKKVTIINIIFLASILIGMSYILLIISSLFYDYTVFVYIVCSISCLLFGNGLGLIMNILNISLLKNIKEEYLSRVAAIFNAGANAASPITAFLISILVSITRIEIIFFVTGILSIILGLAIKVLKIKFSDSNNDKTDNINPVYETKNEEVINSDSDDLSLLTQNEFSEEDAIFSDEEVFPKKDEIIIEKQ